MTFELIDPQISAEVFKVFEEKDPHRRKEKILALVGRLSQKELETAGKILSVAQLKEILIAASLKVDQSKLLPLFVGLLPANFRDLLVDSNEEIIEGLKRLAAAEPIQHHLTLLSFELHSEMKDYFNNLEAKAYEIDGLFPKDLDLKEINDTFHGIERLVSEGEKICGETRNALAITWCTNRTDLIEQLSSIKESCQRSLIQTIGNAKNLSHHASGLWGQLERRLGSVFDEDSVKTSVDSLIDEEPAIEGLSKFSIWYPQDYWELGLLRDIEDKRQFEFNSRKLNDSESIKYRERLASKVQKNLECLGLKTVRDLKNAHIYSKRALLDFIAINRDKLFPS